MEIAMAVVLIKLITFCGIADLQRETNVIIENQKQEITQLKEGKQCKIPNTVTIVKKS